MNIDMYELKNKKKELTNKSMKKRMIKQMHWINKVINRSQS